MACGSQKPMLYGIVVTGWHHAKSSLSSCPDSGGWITEHDSKQIVLTGKRLGEKVKPQIVEKCGEGAFCGLGAVMIGLLLRISHHVTFCYLYS
jgi:hypothetical protein